KALVSRGVVVSNQTRQGRVGLSRPLQSRRWESLSEREQREVREQHGWPAPPPVTFGEELLAVFSGRPPEPGNPERSVWWRDERRVWQPRPADARPWAQLTDAERTAVRSKVGDRLPKGVEPVSWRFYQTNDGWDGWDDARWVDDDDVVQGIVLLRKGQESLPALA